MNLRVTETLMRLGFTRYEALAYVALLRRSPLTGYELAKTSGVPRPNIYAVLDRLEERGAVMRVNVTSATQFVPVASGELVGRLRRNLEQTLREAETSLVEVSEKATWEPVTNSRGYDAAVGLAQDVVIASTRELLIAVWPQEAEALADSVNAADARGVEITTLCLAGCRHGCGFCRGKVHRYLINPDKKARWLVLARDNTDVLTAEIRNQEAVAVRTRQRLLVELAAWYIRHTIALASIVKDLETSSRMAGSPEAPPPELLSGETRAILNAIGSNGAGRGWLEQLGRIIHASAGNSADATS